MTKLCNFHSALKPGNFCIKYFEVSSPQRWLAAGTETADWGLGHRVRGNGKVDGDALGQAAQEALLHPLCPVRPLPPHWHVQHCLLCHRPL